MKEEKKEEKTIKRSIRQFARMLTTLWRWRKNDKAKYKDSVKAV